MQEQQEEVRRGIQRLRETPLLRGVMYETRRDLEEDLQKLSDFTLDYLAYWFQRLDREMTIARSAEQLRSEIDELRRQLNEQALHRVRWVPPLDSPVKLTIFEQQTYYAVPISFTVVGSFSEIGAWKAPEGAERRVEGYLLYLPGGGWSGAGPEARVLVDGNLQPVVHPHTNGRGVLCLGDLDPCVSNWSLDTPVRPLLRHRDEVAKTLSWINLDSLMSHPRSWGDFLNPERAGWEQVSGGQGLWFTNPTYYRCCDCGYRTTDSSEMVTCDYCMDDVCEECAIFTDEGVYCYHCVEQCPSCEQYFLRVDLGYCRRCHRDLCQDCYPAGQPYCSECLEELKELEEEEEEE